MKIAFIGSGNVATNLAVGLNNTSHKIVQIISKNISHANELASKVNALADNNISKLRPEPDLIFICIRDQEIENVIKQMNSTNALIVHTAGSVSIDVLSKFPNHGVFYPYQTFSKNKKVVWDKLPILIEANNEKNTQILNDLGRELSSVTIKANSLQRLHLHIAAVLACNFVNHLYTLSHQLLTDNNLDFKLIHPLIKETAEKLQTMSPFEAQTGPAVRNDINIINKHLDSLADNPSLQNTYKVLSESILNHHLEKK